LKTEWEKENAADAKPDADKVKNLEIPKPYPTAFDPDG